MILLHMSKSRGSKKIVNKTKKRTIHEENRDLCAICQDELTIRELLFTHNTCKNIFHKRCITSWCEKLDEDDRDCSCPMCREIIVPIEYNLEQEYDNLAEENDELLDDYNKLVSKYNVLHNKYNEIAVKYNNLVLK
jgi:hypothetical protein